IFADLERLHAIQERPGRVGVVGIEVGKRPRRARGVPLLAARHTGVTAHTDVEVDDEGKLRHGPFLLPAKYASHAGRCTRAAGTGAAGANCGELSAGSSAAAG